MMNKWGITVKCETEGQASNLAKLIKTQTGLEVNVRGGTSMSIDLDCGHPPDKVKRYGDTVYDDDGPRFCTQCNQRVMKVTSYETRKDGRRDKDVKYGCLHPPNRVKKIRWKRSIDGDWDGKICWACGHEVVEVRYYLLPDLADAQSKLPDADGDAPGIDHLLVMPERVDDTAGRGEPAEA